MFKPVTILLIAACCLPLAPALAKNTGPFGGWAADKADCKYVNTRVGVARDVTAGIITPLNVFFHGGECDVTGAYPQPPNGYLFKGTCDEGDGPYDETLKVIMKGANTMRAKWPEIGWTTFHRCWNLPGNWKALSGH